MDSLNAVASEHTKYGEILLMANSFKFRLNRFVIDLLGRNALDIDWAVTVHHSVHIALGPDPEDVPEDDPDRGRAVEAERTFRAEAAGVRDHADGLHDDAVLEDHVGADGPDAATPDIHRVDAAVAVVPADWADSAYYTLCIHAMWSSFRRHRDDGHALPLHDVLSVTDSRARSHRDSVPSADIPTFYGLDPFEMATSEVIRAHIHRDGAPLAAMTADADSANAVHRDVDAVDGPYSEALDLREIAVPIAVPRDVVGAVAVIHVDSDPVPAVVPGPVPEDDGVLHIDRCSTAPFDAVAAVDFRGSLVIDHSFCALLRCHAVPGPVARKHLDFAHNLVATTYSVGNLAVIAVNAVSFVAVHNMAPLFAVGHNMANVVAVAVHDVLVLDRAVEVDPDHDHKAMVPDHAVVVDLGRVEVVHMAHFVVISVVDVLREAVVHAVHSDTVRAVDIPDAVVAVHEDIDEVDTVHAAVSVDIDRVVGTLDVVEVVHAVVHPLGMAFDFVHLFVVTVLLEPAPVVQLVTVAVVALPPDPVGGVYREHDQQHVD